MAKEFTVTRTKDNCQLGLSVLINSLELGETKVFVEKSAHDTLLNENELLKAELQTAVEALEQFLLINELSFDFESGDDETLDKLSGSLDKSIPIAEKALATIKARRGGE